MTRDQAIDVLVRLNTARMAAQAALELLTKPDGTSGDIRDVVDQIDAIRAHCFTIIEVPPDAA